jgi:exopolyphosphatase / guanosine-5'-triphosphate,3'-diphosphate pyrophosphatase
MTTMNTKLTHKQSKAILARTTIKHAQAQIYSYPTPMTQKSKAENSSLDVYAAIDLGSNSFRLQLARLAGGQFYELDSIKEPVRLGTGVTISKKLDPDAEERALACLKKFAERIRGLPDDSVRAVGTNALRVAKNSAAFVKKAEAALGRSIEVIAGREEARLIYLGVMATTPSLNKRRLVIDIGGGSTEFIIGDTMKPLMAESLYMGCVSYTEQFFASGSITAQSMRQAELAASAEVVSIARDIKATKWDEAIGSSGTARTIADILQKNGWGDGTITRSGVKQLRAALIAAGHINKIDLPGLPADRQPIIVGGFAIMSAALQELNIESMQLSDGALRHGVLYDLAGRVSHHDMRDVTAAHFAERNHIDRQQAIQVHKIATYLLSQLTHDLDEDDLEDSLQLLGWAAQLHEVGLSIAYSGYHKHGAYIIQNADLPGFSKTEQYRLAVLILAHRGALDNLSAMTLSETEWAMVFALRIAVLLCRSRIQQILPGMTCQQDKQAFHLFVDGTWLEQNPLTETMLEREVAQWSSVGRKLIIKHQSASIGIGD